MYRIKQARDLLYKDIVNRSIVVISHWFFASLLIIRVAEH